VLELLLALFTTATVGILLVPLLRTRHRTTDRLDHEIALYRDQLAEVERERAAGRLSDTEAAAARTEIERRVLAAADKPETPGHANPDWHKYLVPALSLGVPLIALGLYLQAGRPGLPSQPWEKDAIDLHTPADPKQQIERTIAQARARLAQNPDDAEALSALGEALTIEAQATVTQPARAALEKAASLNPDDPRTQYYLGLAEAQAGDSRAALTRWLSLEARAPQDAPWLAMLRSEIQRVAKAANIDPKTIAPERRETGMPQPSAEQMQQMQNLSPEQRQQAIRGMVEGLAQRLAQNPNDRAGWLRLANARRVLGDLAPAAEAYARADALQPLEPALLADWAEAHVRQIAPGTPPPPEAIAVLERLEKAEPRNALALFYLGAASYAAGDKPAAARRWKTLLAMLPADAPIRAQLEERIRDAERP
jgi:cytochrome c-type biogenesis protein CcmH